MTPTRLTICAATLVLLSAASAAAEPAYVASTVNLRAGAGTSNEIVAKIPAGSLVDATNCSDWCEVEWQGKKGFAIATALDRSGRVPAPRARRAACPPPARRRRMSRTTTTCRSAPPVGLRRARPTTTVTAIGRTMRLWIPRGTATAIGAAIGAGDRDRSRSGDLIIAATERPCARSSPPSSASSARSWRRARRRARLSRPARCTSSCRSPPAARPTC